MHPVASSCFLLFCYFRFSGLANKFRKNYIKIIVPEASQRNKVGREWTHQGPRRVSGAPLGRAGHPPGCPVPPLGAPFGLYLVPAEETPNTDLLFPFSSIYHRRCHFKIRAARRSCPGTLLEGGTPSERPSIAMDASRICRE